MAKRGITTVLKRGSHKQRAALLFVNMLNTSVPGGKRTLTQKEEQLLDESLTAPGGATAYNEYLDILEKVKKIALSLDSAFKAYARDTLVESLTLEQFVSSYNYRALGLKLSQLDNTEVKELLQLFRPHFRGKESPHFLGRKRKENLLHQARKKRRESLQTAKAFEEALRLFLKKHKLEAAKDYITHYQHEIEKATMYEASIYLVTQSGERLNTPKGRAYIRAYATVVPELEVLLPLIYSTTPVDREFLEELHNILEL